MLPALITPPYWNKEYLRDLKLIFLNEGYVRLPGFFTFDAMAHIQNEVRKIEESKISRDFQMPGYMTPRKMKTIGGKTIRSRSPYLMSLYDSFGIRNALHEITGQQINPCQHPSEFMVINFLEGMATTHGWHVDDPQLALVVVVEAPPSDAGGLLEYITSWPNLCVSVGRNPEKDISEFTTKLATLGLARQIFHAPGDTYLLRADMCVHRVSPLTSKSHRRVALNLAYEISVSPTYGETASLLYD